MLLLSFPICIRFFVFGRCRGYLCSTRVLLVVCSLSLGCSPSFVVLRRYALLRALFAAHYVFDYCLSLIFFAFLCSLSSLTLSSFPFSLSCRFVRGGLAVLGLGLPEAPEGFPYGTVALHQPRAAAAHRLCKSRRPFRTRRSTVLFFFTPFVFLMLSSF